MSLLEEMQKLNPILQKLVEQKLEIDLGFIEIANSNDFIKDVTIKYDLSNSQQEKLKQKLSGKNVNPSFVNSSMPEKIYMRENILEEYFGCAPEQYKEIHFTHILLHEQTHLAHINIVKKSLTNYPIALTEGFAEYMTYKIIKDTFKINPRCTSKYKEHLNYFKEEVKQYNLKTADDFKVYLLIQ